MKKKIQDMKELPNIILPQWIERHTRVGWGVPVK